MSVASIRTFFGIEIKTLFHLALPLFFRLFCDKRMMACACLEDMSALSDCLQDDSRRMQDSFSSPIVGRCSYQCGNFVMLLLLDAIRRRRREILLVHMKDVATN